MHSLSNAQATNNDSYNLVENDTTRYEPLRPKQFLSLEGGGIRGLLTGRLLQEIVNAIGAKVTDIFDGIGGASVGSLLAAGFLVPDDKDPGQPKYTVRQVCDIFEEYGPSVFGETYLEEFETCFGVRKSLYKSDGLKNVINVFAGDKVMKDLLKPVWFPSFTMPSLNDNRYSTVEFTQETAGNMKLYDVLLSGTAAPTYFSAHVIKKEDINPKIFSTPPKIAEGRAFCDGGFFANDPSAEASVEFANRFNSWGSQKMLCIGTGEIDINLKLKDSVGLGDLGWAPLFLTAMFQTQQDAAKRLAAKINHNSNNYTKIEMTIPLAHQLLDNVTPANIKWLNEAPGAWKDNNEELFEEICRSYRPYDRSERLAIPLEV